jgi:hypothetical protein
MFSSVPGDEAAGWIDQQMSVSTPTRRSAHTHARERHRGRLVRNRRPEEAAETFLYGNGGPRR